MPSSVIELDVNGADEEFLAQPGTTLLSALRDTLGLTAAKRGCGVGHVRHLHLPVDGEAVMSCLVPVETINGSSVKTLEGTTPADGSCRRSSRRSWTASPPSAASARPGMIMAAEALLAENPHPTREDVVTRDLRQRLPLHGLREHHQRDPRRAGGGHRMSATTSFNVIGKPVQRSDALGHVTGRTQFFEDVNPAGLLHLKMHRSERHHANIVSTSTRPPPRRSRAS